MSGKVHSMAAVGFIITLVTSCTDRVRCAFCWTHAKKVGNDPMRERQKWVPLYRFLRTKSNNKKFIDV